MRLASCCSVEVMNGAAGRRVYGFSSTDVTANEASPSFDGEIACVVLRELHGVLRAQRAVLREVAALGDALAVDRGEPGRERAGVERARRCPSTRRRGTACARAPARRRAASPPTARARPTAPASPSARAPARPRSRRDGRGCAAPPARRRGWSSMSRVSVERALDRGPRDLVEDHAAHRHLRLQHLDEVPGDRLAFAVFVRREQELVGVLQLRLQVGDDLLLPRSRRRRAARSPRRR